MNAIDIMNEEHKYIKRMLKVVRSACFKTLQNEDVSYEDFRRNIARIYGL